MKKIWVKKRFQVRDLGCRPGRCREEGGGWERERIGMVMGMGVSLRPCRCRPRLPRALPITGIIPACRAACLS